MKTGVHWLAAVVVAVCLLVFMRSLSCDFINWDDPLYVTENPAIRILDWEFVRSAFTTSYMGWWMPLTWISFALDYRMWGLNPFGYHLTNILLHAANAGLVVLIADQLFGPYFKKAGCPAWVARTAALFSGLLWGIHPLRVESVAWVTERKDVLNGLFALGSVLLYLYFVQRKDRGEKGPAVVFIYLCSLFFLFLSITAKPVSVVIPAMLLVMDWYPLGRLIRGGIAGCITEKIPFALISLATALATLYLASGDAILVSFHDLSLYKRLIMAGNAIFEYLRMTIYPAGLTNLYLIPQVFPVSYYLGALASGAAMIYCATGWRSRPWQLSTMLLFLLPLLPVLGFFQNGAQAYADRFTYLPGVALSIAAAGFLGHRLSGLRGARRMLLSLVALAVVLILASLSVHLTAAWQNAETLWTRVIEQQPAGRAFYLRAEDRMRKGRYQDAADDLAVSIRMGEDAGYPGVFYLHALRGDALSKAGRYESAVKEFTTAIRLKPYSSFLYQRGMALKALGRQRAAEDDFREAGGDDWPLDWRNIPDN
ncbi:MAG: hypothetical protein M0T70_18515 [Geobacteraceae bacterium]|nr:hypothetical protein [Geobacteraceae bacterium]